MDSPSPDSSEDEDGRVSNFKLEVAISIGYQRQRTTMAGKLEGPLISLGLLLGGIAVVLFILWRVFQFHL